jgi:hypothetical protein
MTLAAIRFATKIEVFSKTKKDSQWSSITFDIENKTDLNEGIANPVEKPLPTEYSELVGKDSGTLVIWSKFDNEYLQELHSITYNDGYEAGISLDPYGRLNHWLGRTYRKYIWKGVNLFLNKKEVFAFDPLYIKKEKTQFLKDPSGELEGATDEIEWDLPQRLLLLDPSLPKKSKIKIAVSALPEQFSGRPKGGLDFPGRYIDENEGISILRHDREVAYDIIPHFGRSASSTSGGWEDMDRWWGCEISFEPCLDEYFCIKNIKRGAVPVKELKDAIYEKIKGKRKNIIERVRVLRAKNKVNDEDAEAASSQGSGLTHGAVEKIAKETKVPYKPKAGMAIDDAEKNRRLDGVIQGLETLQLAKFNSKFQAQPYTVFDKSWTGSTFVNMTYVNGKTALEYNRRHSFFDELYAIRDELKEIADTERSKLLAKRLDTLIDIMIMSFSKAREGFDENEKYTANLLFEQLISDWGRFLDVYIKAYKEETSGEKT